ncbi:alpha/beta hydrolase [Gordonia terrae]|uniref:Alpha/beta hydrolase n=2 Tax=Gordonia terrae TaxID=2055 RepID=A0AAD0KAH3_9ACTN|nr:alpha/beta hydrolase [Gordonia terrae]VTR09540.1 alpha/beta fold family hydrolase [Clostridioides difficile]ANY22162.1 alpha/beta hydrolase [Gordonia terrae]AWO82902.1 alpha/beta hydrolase [Gordonia terrae]VTS28774.1 Esterase/lipase [Gordonia terrae]GAB46386.1 hypothetical protein GOTRE_150_01270 [Gordonia terrae NBRC 100016]
MSTGTGEPRFTITRLDVSFLSGPDRCRAWLYLPDDTTTPPPVVVLGHGLGGTREMRLDAFAERFAAAGIAALAFTYRHFGDSEGSPRQLLSIGRQLQDWEAAIRFVRGRDDVDGTRTGLWGSSFGGGHALTIGARHPELAAVIAQCPFTDGLASARAASPIETARVVGPVVRDLIAMVARRPPVTIPIASKPGSVGLMSAPDALPGYVEISPPGMNFENSAAARAIPSIVRYRPGRSIRSIASPVFVCVSNTDSVTPAGPTLRYATTARHAQVKRYEAGHFDFYTGPVFEELATDQVAFLVRHLAPEVRR